MFKIKIQEQIIYEWEKLNLSKSIKDILLLIDTDIWRIGKLYLGIMIYFFLGGVGGAITKFSKCLRQLCMFACVRLFNKTWCTKVIYKQLKGEKQDVLAWQVTVPLPIEHEFCSLTHFAHFQLKFKKHLCVS